MSQESAVVGVIGGTGVYKIEGMTDIVELEVNTPFGAPSSKIVLGSLGNIRVAFIARHDRTHRLLPSEIPFRANIYAFKSIGVKYILSFTACGSLKEAVRPGDVCLADQYYDNTKHRGANNSFFGNGIIAHVALADPICPVLSKIVRASVERVAATIPDTLVHIGGTYVCIEGPTFSTKAESHVYRSWGATVIGMTGCPEVKLAREAEIAYASVSLVTDYDCWHPDHDNVTVEMVMETLKKNGNLAQLVVKDFAATLAQMEELPVSPAHSALKNSIMTHSEHISQQLRDSIGIIINKYV